jgi:hypothetical protein
VLKVGNQAASAAAAGATAGATVFVIELPRAQAEEMAFLIAKKTDLAGATGGPHILAFVIRGTKDKGTGYVDIADPTLPAKKDAPVTVGTFDALFPPK